jgi:hypothetical protein
MRISGKILASAAALAFISGVSISAAQAVTPVGKIAAPSQLDLVKGKKKSRKSAGKRTGPGHCGVMKYWDKKTRSCADATTKKV